MLARMRAWFAETSLSTGRMAWAGVAVAAVALVAAWPLLPEQQAELAAVKLEQTVPSVPAVAEGEFPTVSTPDTQWVKMQQFDALLAVQDTSQLTDREINFLLY